MSSWKDNLRTIDPYVPGEQPQLSDMIKLNTNENPYPPSPSVLDALAKVDNNSFRKYPDPDVTDLVQAIADYHHFKKENVFVGVGSDDVLAMCFLSFFNSGKEILFPDVSFGQTFSKLNIGKYLWMKTLTLYLRTIW